MTNEEKAKEISDICKNCLIDGINGCSECEKAGKYLGALEMAEWKDKQFKEIKDAFIAFCYNIINGMYVSIEDAAKEQLEYLED